MDSHPGPCKCWGGGYRKIATRSLRRTQTPLTCHTLGQTLSFPVIVLSLTDDPSINPAPGASTRKRGAFPLWLTRVPPWEQTPAALWLPAVGSNVDSSSYAALTRGTATLHLDHPGGSDRHTSCPAVGPQLWSEWLQVTQDTALRSGRGASLEPRALPNRQPLPAPQHCAAGSSPQGPGSGAHVPRRPTSAGRRALRWQDAASQGPHAN